MLKLAYLLLPMLISVHHSVEAKPIALKCMGKAEAEPEEFTSLLSSIKTFVLDDEKRSFMLWSPDKGLTSPCKSYLICNVTYNDSVVQVSGESKSGDNYLLTLMRSAGDMAEMAGKRKGSPPPIYFASVISKCIDTPMPAKTDSPQPKGADNLAHTTAYV